MAETESPPPIPIRPGTPKAANAPARSTWKVTVSRTVALGVVFCTTRTVQVPRAFAGSWSWSAPTPPETAHGSTARWGVSVPRTGLAFAYHSSAKGYPEGSRLAPRNTVSHGPNRLAVRVRAESE